MKKIMNIKNCGRIICISILTFMLLLSSIGIAFAATSQELRDQQSSLDAKIEQTNTEIAGVKLGMLPQGKWRPLNDREMRHLTNVNKKEESNK